MFTGPAALAAAAGTAHWAGAAEASSSAGVQQTSDRPPGGVGGGICGAGILGLGFRVQGSGFRVQGSGFRV
jgi:hypothetical protein